MYCTLCVAHLDGGQGSITQTKSAHRQPECALHQPAPGNPRLGAHLAVVYSHLLASRTGFPME